MEDGLFNTSKIEYTELQGINEITKMFSYISISIVFRLVKEFSEPPTFTLWKREV